VSGLVYVDASALVKLIVDEAESGALVRYLADRPAQLTSELSSVEVRRAVLRAGLPDRERTDAVLAQIAMHAVTRSVLHRAAALGPATLRTLDAIHLATALELGGDLDAFLTYDARLQEAAREHGAALAAPR
jgi:uncharacterized protein